MSKTSVPDVYARVIKDVCEASRQDFEEGGVDLGALELLMQGWQKRLSSEQIATFPWDPKPEPVHKAEPIPTPSVKPIPVTLPSNAATLTQPSSHSLPGPHVKQENLQYATREPGQGTYAGAAYPQAHLTAQQRASMALQERFGPQAAPQIAQLSGQRVPPQANTQASSQQQQQPQQQTQQPYIKQEVKQEDVGGHNYPPQNYNSSVTIKQSQMDGSGDVRAEYNAEIAHRRTLVAQHREAGDRLIRDRVIASQQAVEGGGLLSPFNEQRPRKSPIRSSIAQSTLQRAQGDAAADDDEEDEDAINSDLDDPDELDETAADEDLPNIMLCTYDKVQRVKNKWKCTLKDGILKVDGSEFVFHKGQGEFEW